MCLQEFFNMSMAPKIEAISLATLGFSAIQTFMGCFYEFESKKIFKIFTVKLISWITISPKPIEFAF